MFLDLENIGQDTIFVTLSCIGPKISNKIAFSAMAALICIYFAYTETLHNISIVITIFLDLENIGQDTIFVLLSCIGQKILNKIAFSVMAVLIWI